MFVTAYNDEDLVPWGRGMRELAWDSFAWFRSEPA